MLNQLLLQFRSMLPRALGEQILGSPVTVVMHPSPWRIRSMGIALVIVHLLSAWIWTAVYPQAYEAPALRVLLALGTLPLLFLSGGGSGCSSGLKRSFVAACWIQLSLFVWWMYFQNGGGAVWLAQVCIALLVYHQVTDWRIASAGTLTGGLLAGLLSRWIGDTSALDEANAGLKWLLIGFAWICAALLGVSASMLRREQQLRNTLATVSIMAHELRTPLSTAALIGDAIRSEASRGGPGVSAAQLERLAERLHGLVRQMNRQIDTQLANARLADLTSADQALSASALVAEVISSYPYRTTRERDSVQLTVHDDFRFRGSASQFHQAVDNLMKNALQALAARGSRWEAGDLHVEIAVHNEHGRISLSDRGTGIPAGARLRVFEPFFSTDRTTGQGLGLSYCERVVRNSGGRIHLRTASGQGTTIIIELPIARRESRG